MRTKKRVVIPRIEEQLVELERRGLDPAAPSSITCIPSSGTPGAVKDVSGCQEYYKCPFHKREYGAKKHFGPFNVPYFHDQAEPPLEPVESFMPCHLFVRQMIPRMQAGLVAIDEGKNGEVIEILAENGVLATEVTLNGGFRVDPERLEKGYARRDQPMEVPAYKYPSEFESPVASKIRKRQVDRAARREAAERGDTPVPTRSRRKPVAQAIEFEDNEEPGGDEQNASAG